MSYLTDDISMAAVNEAKVVDLEETVKGARALLDSHLLDTSHAAAIQDALDRIKNTEDYQVQPEMVEEIDGLINTVGNILVTRGDEVDLISGTESFGITLTPKEWRKTRIAGCESILDELAKSIKAYSNRLSEKLSEIFTGHRYTISSLKGRLEEADKKLMFIETLRDDLDFVTVTEFVNAALQVKGKVITPQPTVDKIIQSEINYLGMALKSWVGESMQYKNRLIKFFGNRGRGSLTDLSRVHPKFMSKKAYIDEDNSNEVTWTIPERFIGMGSLFFTEHSGTPANLTEVVYQNGIARYEFVSEYNSGNAKINDLNLKPLSITQLESISKSVKLCISLMEAINDESNDFDANGRDIKDILNTLKSAEDPVLLDSFSGMVTHYQQNTTFTQAGFINYLGRIASALITFMFINMEGYDDA